MTEHSRYEYIDGIHYFRFLDVTSETIDKLADEYFELLGNYTPDDTIKLIIDFRIGGTPHLSYAFAALRRSLARRGKNNMPVLHVAYMYTNEPVISIVSTFLDMLRLRVRRRFFDDSYSEEDVLEWLYSLD